jgi:hypothetical protein
LDRWGLSRGRSSTASTSRSLEDGMMDHVRVNHPPQDGKARLRVPDATQPQGAQWVAAQCGMWDVGCGEKLGGLRYFVKLGTNQGPV